MNLLHFAHRGEAQYFIKSLSLSAHKDFEGFYLNDNLCLLITGEGVYASLSKISFILGMMPITKVINLGIAGALDKNLQLDEIYQIRTSYAFNSKPEFKSFTTLKENNKSTLDCITSFERVIKEEQAIKLSAFAQIVDRELWSIGQACKTKRIPFESYKLISDYAGVSTDCFDIKHRALEFSKSLFDFYNSINITEIQEKELEFPIKMTFSHKKQFEKLMKIASLKEEQTSEEILKRINIDSIKELKLKDKEKASLIIERISTLINPIDSKAIESLNKTFSPFTQIGAKVNFDKKLEKQNFTIQMEINSQSNIDNLKRALDLFKYKEHQRIWQGDFDV